MNTPKVPLFGPGGQGRGGGCNLPLNTSASTVRRQLWGNVGVRISLHHVVDMRLLTCIFILRLTGE